MNKFEHVSSDDHQMSLAGGFPGLMFEGGCIVRSNASWVMVTWEPRGWND